MRRKERRKRGKKMGITRTERGEEGKEREYGRGARQEGKEREENEIRGEGRTQ